MLRSDQVFTKLAEPIQTDTLIGLILWNVDNWLKRESKSFDPLGLLVWINSDYQGQKELFTNQLKLYGDHCFKQASLVHGMSVSDLCQWLSGPANASMDTIVNAYLMKWNEIKDRNDQHQEQRDLWTSMTKTINLKEVWSNYHRERLKKLLNKVATEFPREPSPTWFKDKIDRMRGLKILQEVKFQYRTNRIESWTNNYIDLFQKYAYVPHNTRPGLAEMFFFRTNHRKVLHFIQALIVLPLRTRIVGNEMWIECQFSNSNDHRENRIINRQIGYTDVLTRHSEYIYTLSVTAIQEEIVPLDYFRITIEASDRHHQAIPGIQVYYRKFIFSI